MSARCRLSPEEELLVLDKATKVAIIAAADAAKETARGANNVSLGEQAGRYVSPSVPDQKAGRQAYMGFPFVRSWYSMLA